MIPSPIRKALSTIRKHQVAHLLMGGQACVLYGAAEFSRDLDLALLLDPGIPPLVPRLQDDVKTKERLGKSLSPAVSSSPALVETGERDSKGREHQGKGDAREAKRAERHLKSLGCLLKGRGWLLKGLR